MLQKDTPTVNMYNGNIITKTHVTMYGWTSSSYPDYFDEVLVYYIMKFINVFSSGLI